MEKAALKKELLQIAKPILFNTEMVKAILEGRKTVTRRLVKDRQYLGLGKKIAPEEVILKVTSRYAGWTDSDVINMNFKEPYLPGDILYVRETWCYHKDADKPWYGYRVDGDYRDIDLKWKPSIHMPKEAARIFLKVKSVRVERLKDMVLADVLMEGIAEANTYEETWERWHNTWDSTINKSDLELYGLDANPYVWVIKFERIELESEV